MVKTERILKLLCWSTACFGACTSNEEITALKAQTVFTHKRLPGLQLEIRRIHAAFILPFFSTKGTSYT